MPHTQAYTQNVAIQQNNDDVTWIARATISESVVDENGAGGDTKEEICSSNVADIDEQKINLIGIY